MKKLQVLLEDNRYVDIFVPESFGDTEIADHCDQLFGETTWHNHKEYN